MAQLFFRYGAMSSGKTIEILKVAHNYEAQGRKIDLILELDFTEKQFQLLLI